MLASKIAYFARNSAGIITKLFLTRQIKCDTYSNWEPCLGSHFCTAFMHKSCAPTQSNVLSEMPSKVLTETRPNVSRHPLKDTRSPFLVQQGITFIQWIIQRIKPFTFYNKSPVGFLKSHKFTYEFASFFLNTHGFLHNLTIKHKIAR